MSCFRRSSLDNPTGQTRGRTERTSAYWRYLWASPWTLLGLAAALASFSMPHVVGPIALCVSNRGFARWFLRQRGYCAITLGHVVLVTGEAPSDVLVHEMAHVRQSERWGPLFIPAYLVAMLLARLRGRDPYWDNPFEIEARTHEAAVRAAASQTEATPRDPAPPTTPRRG